MASGTVKWFNPTKGYGFIQPSGGGGKDVFVHISAVERAGLSTLNEGQQVDYEIVSNRGKESAENLKVRNDATHETRCRPVAWTFLPNLNPAFAGFSLLASRDGLITVRLRCRGGRRLVIADQMTDVRSGSLLAIICSRAAGVKLTPSAA